MSLTRAQVESQLLNRAAALMTRVGLDGVTKDGTNAALNDPIRKGLAFLGLYAADITNVVDSDLAMVTGNLAERLLDFAEWRLLGNIWGQWAYFSQTISLGRQEAQQLADRIQARIADLEESLRQPFGPNVGGGAIGAISRGRFIPADNRERPWMRFPGGGYTGGYPGGW